MSCVETPRRTATVIQSRRDEPRRWKSTAIALELHWNCTAFPIQTAAPNRDGGTDTELHWNCIGIALELH
jgi:hypothetical protein